MFALVTWAWRQGRRDVADHLLQMGLWNLAYGVEPDQNCHSLTYSRRLWNGALRQLGPLSRA